MQSKNICSIFLGRAQSLELEQTVQGIEQKMAAEWEEEFDIEVCQVSRSSCG